MPDTIQPIFDHAPLFLLVMFRLLGIFVFGPLFSLAAMPYQLRALLSLALAFCIYPMIPVQPPMELSLITISLAVGSEMMIGLIIGFGAYIPLVGLQIAGLMVGHQIGLGLAQVFSPDTGEQTEILGQLMFLIAVLIFVILNGHHILIAILIRSFQTIPLGGYMPDGAWLQLLCGILDAMFSLGIRLCVPVLCIIFLETIAIGFIAKTIPAINIISIGFPLRIMLGIFTMIIIVAVQFEVASDVINNMLGNLMKFFT